MSNPNQPKRLSRKAQLLASVGIVLFAFVAAYFSFKAQVDAESPAADGPAAEGIGIYYADIVVENYGTITVELNGDIAPITVNNFVSLAKDGFYDGLTFHRIIRGFMIQGGDPKGNGTGGPGHTIKGEFAANGVKNTLKHTRGVLSMARSGNPNSAGSQFFIMHEDAPHLDGQYAAFGKVIEGMDVVDEIANTPTFYDFPFIPQVMKKVTAAE